MDVLEIEWDWSVFRLSDGQRRRVQLLLGLASSPAWQPPYRRRRPPHDYRAGRTHTD